MSQRFIPSVVRALLPLGAGAALLFAASPAAARELYWKSVEVGATLDARGVLQVVERQHMVFTGDWNGGERRFELKPGQEIVLRGMTRLDPATGARRAMQEGSLDELDRFAWVSDRVLRWRSRLPGDPPFARTEIVYDIAYSLYGALVETGGRYLLNHDFAFAERPGDIEDVAVTLRIDPAWRVDGAQEQTFHSGRLRPGSGYVVRTELEWAGAGEPALQLTSARQARLLLALAGVPLLLLVQLLASEWSRGRFARLTPEAASQPGWLEANLLRHPAELIGAVWDRSVGSDEVAATIARLTGEGKLETRVDGERELHMKLKVDREKLGGHERALIDGFFFDGGSETSTSDVRSHYESRGFNPTILIQPALEAQAKELVGPSARSKWLPLWLPTLVAFVWGAYLLWTAAPATAEGRVPRLLLMLPLLVLCGIASAIAATWRGRIDRGPLGAIAFLIPSGLMLLFAGAFVSGFRGVPLLSRLFSSGWSFDVRLGATLLALALFNSVINQARSRERAQGIALRKRLASARRYFQQELSRPRPALRNEWFPYVLAFGLDDDARDWFKAYGGKSASGSDTSTWSTSTTSSSSGGGSWSSSPTGWTGGGGSFGGAGATVGWAAAASSLAAGVAAPSSSSSSGGGGGGGGSSSGGGGGGGW